MLLRVLSTCPGTGWVPGQVVQATPAEADEWADGVHAVPVRGAATEQATTRFHPHDPRTPSDDVR